MTVPLTPEEQELYEWLKGSLPSWFWQRDDIAEEIWYAAVKGLGKVRDLVHEWADRTYIAYSDGVWLEQHARDKGTWRQNGESDAGLIARLQTPLEAVTVSALLDGVTSLLNAYHITWTPNLLELWPDGSFYQVYNTPAGTGDWLAVNGTTVTLTDNGYTFCGYEIGRTIHVTACSHSENNGTFTITDVTGDHSITFTNASGIAESGSFHWRIDDNYDTNPDAYFDRGYRYNGICIVIVLPSECTDAQLASARELVRLRKAAGVVAVVERTP